MRRRGGAVLAAVGEARELEDGGDLLEVGVVEDHHRRLAAELEVDALQALGGGPGDDLAGADVAGDRDHADLRMAHEAGADRFAVAGDDVEDAGGEDVGGELGEAQRGERRLLRRLEDHRVAGGQRRADLPDRHHQRVVPRRDRGDDAHRLAAGERGVAGEVLAGGLALHAARGAGEEAQVVDQERDLALGEPVRLADVRGLEEGELVGVRLDPVGELQQHPGALAGGAVEPALEGVMRGVDGALDVLGAAHRHLRQDLLGRRARRSSRSCRPPPPSPRRSRTAGISSWLPHPCWLESSGPDLCPAPARYAAHRIL